MNSQLENVCEEYFIQLFGTNEILASVDRRHWDGADPATPGIVVQAVQAASRLDGSKGFDVTMTIEYRATNASPAQNAEIADAITDTIVNAKDVNVDALLQLGYMLLLTENMTGSRNFSANVRKFEKVLPIIARTEPE